MTPAERRGFFLFWAKKVLTEKTLGEPKETDTEMISVEEYIRRFNPKTETRTTKSGTELVTVYFETGAKEYQKKLLHKNFVQVKKEA